MIVFDFTRRDTFLNVAKWLQLLRLHATQEDPPVTVLGNKRDMDRKHYEVSNDDIEEFQSVNRTTIFYEVSAKSGLNVEEAFVELCTKMSDSKKSIGLKLRSGHMSKAIE